MLPKDLIWEILSFKSPLDAARFSLASKKINSIIDSDWEIMCERIWGSFLPLEIQQRLGFPINFNSKRELFHKLHHSPIMLDHGNSSFYLDKNTGKNCLLVGAKELEIEHVDDPNIWTWTSCEASRLSVAALFGWGHRTPYSKLCIKSLIKTRTLSKRTMYGVYLKYKIRGTPGDQHLSHGWVKYTGRKMSERSYLLMHFNGVVKIPNPTYPTETTGGWKDIEIGDFYVDDHGEDSEVKAWVRGVGNGSSDVVLILEGIEFRPKY